MSIISEHSHLIFQKTERDLLKLSISQQAETVHSFRTTTRRLQTLLEELIPRRHRNEKKLLKMLDRIRRRAGKVRDLDVQLSALRSLKTPQQPRRKTQLMHTLIELRAKHEDKLSKVLTKESIREIRKRLKKASREVDTEGSRDPLAAAREMLAQVERRSGSQTSARPLTEDLLHRYRMVVKRARYAAEFAPKSAESSQFIAELKRLQDAVGNWHDWLTLTHSATTRLGGVNESSLVAALHNVTGAKFRQAATVLSTSPVIKRSLKPIAMLPEHSRKPGTPVPKPEEHSESAA
jgi:CHAD domain-containing protein